MDDTSSSNLSRLESRLSEPEVLSKILETVLEPKVESEQESESKSKSSQVHWRLFGSIVPEREVVFLAQILILYFIIISSVIILAKGIQPKELWISLLSAAIGIIVPTPSLHKIQYERKRT